MNAAADSSQAPGNVTNLHSIINLLYKTRSFGSVPNGSFLCATMGSKPFLNGLLFYFENIVNFDTYSCNLPKHFQSSFNLYDFSTKVKVSATLQSLMIHKERISFSCFTCYVHIVCFLAKQSEWLKTSWKFVIHFLWKYVVSNSQIFDLARFFSRLQLSEKQFWNFAPNIFFENMNAIL